MHNRPEKIFLVVPCFNEEQRIDLSKFSGFPYHFIFVDDGSSDQTYKLLESQKKEHWSVLKLEKNVGKAEAVRAGVRYALEKSNLQSSDWVGFWDADLATPLEEVERFLQYQNQFYPKASAIWGSRVKRLGSDIDRSFKRHVLGRCFATLVGIIFEMRVYDTQCGAKLFSPALGKKIFQDPFISRWLFDIELLLRSADAQVVECSLSQWAEIPGSKVKIIKESRRILADLLKIYLKYK